MSTTSHGFGRLVSFHVVSQRDRWYERVMSASSPQMTEGAPRRKCAVDWDKVLGMTLLLLVSGVGWTAVGVAVSYFLR